AFAGLFVGTLVVGAVVGFMARALVTQTGLTGTDRVLGAVFGGLRGVLVVGVLVLLAGLTSLPRESWWRESVAAAALQPWVCRLGVYHWMEGVRLYRPVTDSAVGPGRPATRYWDEFCGVVTAPAALVVPLMPDTGGEA
ncbi:MAG: CvpA family protein, partial [Candidatus Competibacterales bacterium]|nr:CvpA family protein [Candidatus Competibacterales bacterium]